MTNQNIFELLDKYRDGTASETEQMLVDNWYNYHVLEKEKKYQSRNKKIIAAFCLAAALSTSVLFYFKRASQDPINQISIASYKYSPGSFRATIHLNNVGSINLQPKDSVVLTSNDEVTVINNHDGTIRYIAHNNSYALRPSVFDTLITQNAGKYILVLTDSTKVTLNAGSTLKYPRIFSGKERNVELTGEAYFEVAKDAEHPFVVSNQGQIVTVLGTEFNIAAYPGDSIRTSLAFGKLRIKQTTTGQVKDLHPGYQAVLGANGISTRKIDRSSIGSWKDGSVSFKQTPLNIALAQLGRWYNVKVAGSIPDKSLTGVIRLDKSLEKALEDIMESAHIQLKIENDTIKAY